MKINIRQSNGITLVALVVTIIVLLILAGITLAILYGDNALMDRAVEAKESSISAIEKEQLQLEVLASYDLNGELYAPAVIINFDDNIGNLSYEPANPTQFPFLVTYNETGNTYEINYGNIVQKFPRRYSDEVKGALTVGKYVTYNGNLYKVLYDANFDEANGTDRGIEIVSYSELETVTLGYEDPYLPNSAEGYDFTGDNGQFEKARWSYNNYISTLNKIAQKYKTELADRARCVGSNPENPEQDDVETSYSNSYTYMNTYNYNNKFKPGGENNYTNNGVGVIRDKNQLDTIDRSSGIHYWLASRGSVSANSTKTLFYFLGVGSNGRYETNREVCMIQNSGLTPYAPSNGFRPVIRLKDSIKITGGDGSTGSKAYTLGL